jgi:hypothetical protein
MADGGERLPAVVHPWSIAKLETEARRLRFHAERIRVAAEPRSAPVYLAFGLVADEGESWSEQRETTAAWLERAADVLEGAAKVGTPSGDASASTANGDR